MNSIQYIIFNKISKIETKLYVRYLIIICDNSASLVNSYPSFYFFCATKQSFILIKEFDE